MNKSTVLIICLAVLAYVPPCLAVEPSLGIGAVISVARELLAAPPLPNLEGGTATLAPQIGYATITKSRSTPGPGGDVNTTGEIKGPNAGLGLSIPTAGDFGFFVFAIGSQVSGEVKSEFNGTQTELDRDIKGSGYSVVAGVSYRLIGDAKSRFAFGVFAGPSFSTIRSRMTIETPAGTYSPTTISVNPTFYGAYEGIQLNARLAGFLINPYIVTSQDFNNQCQKIEVESGDAPMDPFTCDGQAGYLQTESKILGLGIFLGYGAFRINAYSANITKMLDETAVVYKVSYAFEL